MRPLLFSAISALIVTASLAAAAPAGFSQRHIANEQMHVFSGSDGIEVRVRPMAAIIDANAGLDPNLKSSDALERMESALYVMDLGMPEITGELKSSSAFPVVEGSAHTEDGDEIQFVATWQGAPGAEDLVLVLVPADQFNADRARTLALSEWVESNPAPSISASKTAEAPAARSTRAATEPKRAARNAKPSQKTAEKLGDYPAPFQTSSSNPRWTGWHYISDNDVVAKKGDPDTPRAKLIAAVSPVTKSPDDALKKALSTYGVTRYQYDDIIETKAARELVGRPNYITMGSSKRNGKDAIFFAQIYQGKDSSDFSVFILEAQKPDFQAWGGIAAALSATGVIDHPTDIPAKHRHALAQAPFDQQIAFFDAAYTQVMMSYLSGLIATNMTTLQMMQNMNYDLLFEGEVSIETMTGVK